MENEQSPMARKHGQKQKNEEGLCIGIGGRRKQAGRTLENKEQMSFGC